MWLSCGAFKGKNTAAPADIIRLMDDDHELPVRYTRYLWCNSRRKSADIGFNWTTEGAMLLFCGDVSANEKDAL